MLYDTYLKTKDNLNPVFKSHTFYTSSQMLVFVAHIPCDDCPGQLFCLNKLITSQVTSLVMGTAHASTTDLLSPWGGEAAVSLENDLISSVNGSVVNKLAASLSTMRGVNLHHNSFPASFQVCFVV